MKLALALTVLATVGIARTSLALEPGIGVGVGGHGVTTTSTGGHGASSIGLQFPRTHLCRRRRARGFYRRWIWRLQPQQQRRIQYRRGHTSI